MRSFLVAFAVVAAFFSVPINAKSENFSKIAPSGTDGAIMFAAPVLPAPYVIWMSQIAADGKPGKTVRLTVSSRKALVDPSSSLAMKMATVGAGTYVVRLVLWQEHWGACLARETVSFSVQPGQISYLGTFNPVETLRNLETEISRTGKTSAHSSQMRMFRDNIAAPSFSASDPALQQAMELARRNGLNGALTAKDVSTHPASFLSPPGSDMLGYCD